MPNKFHWISYSFLLIFLQATLLHADPLQNQKSLVGNSYRHFFLLDASISDKARDVDNGSFFGLTGLYGASSSIAVNDALYMSKPSEICSAYDKAICHSLGSFYNSKVPSIITTGGYKLDRDTVLGIGINTGYNSEKLEISPSLMVGAAKRFYTSADHSSHLIVEGNYWLGGTVKHSPCLDAFNRQYFCGNLTAWKDFSYDAHPSSYNANLWYEIVF